MGKKRKRQTVSGLFLPLWYVYFPPSPLFTWAILTPKSSELVSQESVSQRTSPPVLLMWAMNFILNYVHGWKSLLLFCFISKLNLLTFRGWQKEFSVRPALMSFFFANCHLSFREELSRGKLVFFSVSLLNWIINTFLFLIYAWHTDNGRLINLCDGSHCQRKNGFVR